MAAVGPYGIEQFDAPSTIANMQNMQFNRIRMMAAQKQLEMQDLMMNRQLGTMKALQAYAASQSPPSATAGSGTSGSGTASAPASAASATPTVMPHADDVVQQPSGPYDQNGIPTAAEMSARANLMRGLLAFNTEAASQLSDTFKNMDASQVAAVTQRHVRTAQIAAGALQVPQSERPAYLQQHLPELQALGWTPQQIQSFQPTDNNLRALTAEGMDVERIAQYSRPDVQSVRQGGALVGTNPDGSPKTLYESPTMVGPNGEVFARPPQLSTMPQTRTATGPHGEKYQLNPQTNQWELIGGQTPPASGGFQ